MVAFTPLPVFGGQYTDMSDEISFNELFAAHRLIVYNQVLRMTRSHWHAEEIVQEVFMKVWIHRKKIIVVRDIKAWLYVVTKRLTFDYMVKLSREERFLSSCKRTDASTDINDFLLGNNCVRLLTEAELILTPRQRELYRLKYIEQMSRREIALKCNIAEFTVRRHVIDAVSKVRSFVMMSLELDDQKRA